MKDHNFLRENNAKYVFHPMAHPAEMRTTPPTIYTEGSGVRITDVDGHEVIDAVGGLWNVNLGFSCQPIVDAITAQLHRLPYTSTFGGSSNDVMIELSWRLSEFFAEDGLTRAFFTSGGSDSVETALRLARQYHKIRGDHGRTKFLSLRKGYHGTHFGGASVNGNPRFRQSYEPLLAGCFHVPCPYTYRNPFDESDPAQLAQLCLAALEDEIAMQGAETIAAFIMEPVLGAGGVIPPHESYMPGVREICTRHGILLISDEVITGFGRTGDWTGARHWGVRPDMATFAKGITNGYFPFGAVMLSGATAEVFETDVTGAAMIGHGYTYSGHPVGAAAALACLDETLRLDVATNAAARGAELFEGMERLKTKHDRVGDVRGGHGLMCGVELVSDRQAKTPADPSVALAVRAEAYRRGVNFRPAGNNLLMSPPLIVTSQDIQTIVDTLDAALAA